MLLHHQFNLYISTLLTDSMVLTFLLPTLLLILHPFSFVTAITLLQSCSKTDLAEKQPPGLGATAKGSLLS